VLLAHAGDFQLAWQRCRFSLARRHYNFPMAAFASNLECDVHLVPFVRELGCTYCRRFLETAPDPKDMAMSVRLDELERWLTARRSVPEQMYYRRIEQLVGRQISLTELNDPDLLMKRAQRPSRQWDWDDW
jgi:alkylhydroperoxidase family enzyme